MAKIAHIFNEHLKNKNTEYINPQEFEIDYIKDYTKGFKSSSINVVDDFSKKYYEALEPSKDNNIISKYDDEKLNSLVERLGDELAMISGDFWGIQKFIFDSLTATKASKILRSRSAMVQLITYVVVDILKKEFKGSDVVLFGAGKFLLLAKKSDNYKQKLQEVQKKLDNYFLKNYFGQNGFILSYTSTTKDRILNQEDNPEIEKDLTTLAKDNELKKFNKFDLLNLDDTDICIDSFRGAKSDDTICPYCSKRVKIDTQHCQICDAQIKLGEKLTKKNYITIYDSKDTKQRDILLFEYKNSRYYAHLFDEYPQDLNNTFDISSNNYDGVPKWSLNSYVAKNDDSIKTFEELQNTKSGLFALKADVDKLGDTFREYYMKSFKKFNRLSRELDFFFSDFATNILEKKYKNTYIIFAGGDDLFLVGDYEEVIAFAKELREEFFRFSLQKATLSMGLVMFKHSTPINYISTLADDAELRAKAVLKDGVDRDGIDIFGISMKFNEFLEIEKSFQTVVTFLENNNVDTTTFYYRLIEFCDMREHIDDDIKNAMWLSKLNYVFRRNIDKRENNPKAFKIIVDLIEKFGEKFKPTLFLKIYQNRDKSK